MARAAEALVTPEVLVWARESLDLSLTAAAKKLKVKPSRLAEWEAGERRPTINQLRKIANAYKRPLAVFFLPKVPKDFQVAMQDFRRLPSDEPHALSMGLRLEIRKAVERRDVALELAKALDVDVPDLTLTCQITELPESVAKRIRVALGVSLDQQRAWTNYYEALSSWRRAVERLGILVFHADQVSVKDARGFSINERPLPAIVLNAKDVPQARIFTLFHELTHLLLSEGSLCDLHEEAATKTVGPDPEVFCNHVSGAVVAPETALRSEPIVMSHGPTKEWRDEEIEGIAKRLWISREAVMRRLTLIGAASSGQYERFRSALAGAPKKTGKGFISPSTKSLRNLGFFFTRLAIGAYRDEVITGSDLADHLELKLKHLPKVEEALARGAQVDEGEA